MPLADLKSPDLTGNVAPAVNGLGLDLLFATDWVSIPARLVFLRPLGDPVLRPISVELLLGFIPLGLPEPDLADHLSGSFAGADKPHITADIWVEAVGCPRLNGLPAVENHVGIGGGGVIDVDAH